MNRDRMFRRATASLVGGLITLGLLANGCSSDGGNAEPPQGGDEVYGNAAEELSVARTVGDWSKFPGGYSCLAGVQYFYPAKFGVRVPLASDRSNGNCAADGACHIWLDTQPDSSEWERIPNDGDHVPTTYDLIVYPPTATNGYGHVASVDHVEGKNILVIDDNYVGHHMKAAEPHTVSWKAYGWYHLKKLGPSSPPPSGGSPPPSGTSSTCQAGGFYCGGDKVAGDSSTLYRCETGGTATKVRACEHGCIVVDGRDDVCRCVAGGSYCGGDVVEGDAKTLYRCNSNSTLTVLKQCPSSCAVVAGQDDACK